MRQNDFMGSKNWFIFFTKFAILRRFYDNQHTAFGDPVRQVLLPTMKFVLFGRDGQKSRRKNQGSKILYVLTLRKGQNIKSTVTHTYPH